MQSNRSDDGSYSQEEEEEASYDITRGFHRDSGTTLPRWCIKIRLNDVDLRVVPQLPKARRV
jgi:hypothetical protein